MGSDHRLPLIAHRSRQIISIRSLFAFAALFLFIASSAFVARADSFVVNTLNDDTISGDSLCTLREAILAANSDPAYNGDCGTASSNDDTITFSVSGTITLSSMLPFVDAISYDQGRLTIDGAGQSIVISGNNSVQIFLILNGSEFTLKNLSVSNGKGSVQGGALINSYATVTIFNCTFSNNSSGGGGGAIEAYGGTTIIEESTFSNNSTVGGFGGGLEVIGGGTVTITDSTFSSNSVSGSPNAGGGLASSRDLFYNLNTVSISNSTFSNNNGSNVGGGIYSDSGSLTIDNSTFDGNTSGNGGGLHHKYIFCDSFACSSPRPGTELNINPSCYLETADDKSQNKADDLQFKPSCSYRVDALGE